VTQNSISYPKVCKDKDGKYWIDFKLNNKRVRMFNGRRINSSTAPNTFPIKHRRTEALKLAKEVYDYLSNNNYSFQRVYDKVEQFDLLIDKKLNEPISFLYKRALKKIALKLRKELVSKDKISVDFIDSLSLRYDNATSYNTTRRHVNVIVNHLLENGFDIERSKLKSKKQIEKLHKPVDNVKGLLELIKKYNDDLYLFCVLTYCCLLRPHQEIRLLKWTDFSDDFKYIKLTGDKVKSKRNRVVPVPKTLRIERLKKRKNVNIFTGTEKPYNRGYFSTLWKRFKKVHKEVDRDVTIYSFRHSGAIEIFKRTGSLTKLQRAMGHSSLQVSLTYLRGLEVTELKEEDMPMV
tara:strand:- start:1944 stop:2990 length:1047 start_codon:yes stop_codon:yes gene_type:complete